MPSQEVERPSGGKSGVHRALADLTPVQKKVFFSIGAALAFLVLAQYAMVEIINPHKHASAFQVGAEYGGRVTLLVMAIGFMVPPFGMWMILHLPIPRFLKRGDK